mmetsp:Transcript_27976/g.58260  ORF Transcript_27976/g.58260 Transcript_27976/m.58260 type:complete len:89 (+) Transcript_27976:762-1028(+)
MILEHFPGTFGSSCSMHKEKSWQDLAWEISRTRKRWLGMPSGDDSMRSMQSLSSVMIADDLVGDDLCQTEIQDFYQVLWSTVCEEQLR